MRRRLRPTPELQQLMEMYPKPHRHDEWVDHRLRVAVTIEVARWMANITGRGRAADLSCGDGAVLNALPEFTQRFYGDFAPGYGTAGPIENTIDDIPSVDLFVNTETLEHVDDPDRVLSLIRGKTRGLVLSTPVDAWQDDNEEHLWAWSRKGVEEMLHRAGFTPVVYTAVDLRPTFVYCFGIWGCT